MPGLIGVYRSMRPTAGPVDHLTSQEVAAVARGVRRLSEGLTRGRRLVGRHYRDNRELLAAYLLYIWPVWYAQGRHVYRELGSKPRFSRSAQSIPLLFLVVQARGESVKTTG
jgi:hypothetical protein